MTLAFATTRPLLLAGLPLAVLLVAYGPRNFKAAIVIGALVGIASLGEKGDLWWFERGWPLLLGGVFVWIVSLRRRWSQQRTVEIICKELTSFRYDSALGGL